MTLLAAFDVSSLDIRDGQIRKAWGFVDFTKSSFFRTRQSSAPAESAPMVSWYLRVMLVGSTIVNRSAKVSAILEFDEWDAVEWSTVDGEDMKNRSIWLVLQHST